MICSHYVSYNINNVLTVQVHVLVYIFVRTVGLRWLHCILSVCVWFIFINAFWRDILSKYERVVLFLFVRTIWRYVYGSRSRFPSVQPPARRQRDTSYQWRIYTRFSRRGISEKTRIVSWILNPSTKHPLLVKSKYYLIHIYDIMGRVFQTLYYTTQII